MRLYLHIGFPKTGSTTIQSALARNADALLERGVLFPRRIAGGGQNHIALSLLTPDVAKNTRFLMQRGFTDRRGEAMWDVIDAAGNKFLAGLKTAIEAADPDAVVLSGEHLGAMVYTTEGAEAVASRLGALFDDVVVIAYARPFQDILPSIYSEQVKGGDAARFAPPEPEPGETAFAAFHRRRDRTTDPMDLVCFFDQAPFALDYSETLAVWEKVFGRAALRLRRVGGGHPACGDLFGDFLETIGVLGLEYSRPALENKSEGAYAALARRAVNLAVPTGPARWRNALRRRLNRSRITGAFGGPPIVWRAEHAPRLAAALEKSENEAAARYLGEERLFG